MLNSRYDTLKASVSVNNIQFAIGDTLENVEAKYKKLANSDMRIGFGIILDKVHDKDLNITYIKMSIYGIDFMKMKFIGNTRMADNGSVMSRHYLIRIDVDALQWAKGMCAGLGLEQWIIEKALKNNVKDKTDRITNNEILDRLFCIKYDNCGLLTSRRLYNKMYERDMSGSTEKEKTAMMLKFENHEGEYEYQFSVVGETCDKNKRAINRITITTYYIISKRGKYRIF